MALAFPNTSRSYDEGARRVRFWGHDGMTEVTFLLDVAALDGLGARPPHTESDVLKAFDTSRDRIQRVARQVYTKQRRDIQVLAASDF
jgi:hypothetical protein